MHDQDLERTLETLAPRNVQVEVSSFLPLRSLGLDDLKTHLFKTHDGHKP